MIAALGYPDITQADIHHLGITYLGHYPYGYYPPKPIDLELWCQQLASTQNDIVLKGQCISI